MQSVLLLPIPLLQRMGARQAGDGGQHGRTCSPARSRRRAIVMALGGTIVLQLLRSGVSWWTAAMMGRISQEVVVAHPGGASSQADAAAHGLFRRPADRVADGPRDQRRRLDSHVVAAVSSSSTSDLILSVAIAVALVWLQWRAWQPVALVPVFPSMQSTRPLFFPAFADFPDQIRTEVSALYALLSERVSAVRVVRSFAREDRELAYLDERIDRHREALVGQYQDGRDHGCPGDIDQRRGNRIRISYGVVLAAAGPSPCALLAFYTLVSQLYGPIVRLSQFQATAVATQVSVERLYEIFDEPEPVADCPVRLAAAFAQGSPGVPRCPLQLWANRRR